MAPGGGSRETPRTSPSSVSELHDRVASVAKNLDELGQRLQQAVSAYNSTVYQTESQVLVTGRRFEKLHAGSGKEVITSLDWVNDVPKNLTAPELKG